MGVGAVAISDKFELFRQFSKPLKSHAHGKDAGTNKELDADGSCFAIVSDLLMGDSDVIQVFERLRSFTQGKPKVDMESQAQGHDMGVVLAELQGGSILRQVFKSMLKKSTVNSR